MRKAQHNVPYCISVMRTHVFSRTSEKYTSPDGPIATPMGDLKPVAMVMSVPDSDAHFTLLQSNINNSEYQAYLYLMRVAYAKQCTVCPLHICNSQDTRHLFLSY